MKKLHFIVYVYAFLFSIVSTQNALASFKVTIKDMKPNTVLLVKWSDGKIRPCNYNSKTIEGNSSVTLNNDSAIVWGKDVCKGTNDDGVSIGDYSNEATFTLDNSNVKCEITIYGITIGPFMNDMGNYSTYKYKLGPCQGSQTTWVTGQDETKVIN